jgi:anti-sigma factor RsiW
VNGLRCAEFVEHITALLDGTLDDKTEHDVRAHLPACPGCRHYLDQMRQIIRALGGLRTMTAATTDRMSVRTAGRRAAEPESGRRVVPGDHRHPLRAGSIVVIAWPFRRYEPVAWAGRRDEDRCRWR